MILIGDNKQPYVSWRGLVGALCGAGLSLNIKHARYAAVIGLAMPSRQLTKVVSAGEMAEMTKSWLLV